MLKLILLCSIFHKFQYKIYSNKCIRVYLLYINQIFNICLNFEIEWSSHLLVYRFKDLQITKLIGTDIERHHISGMVHIEQSS